MNKLLIRLFQILCLLQLVGHGELNAYQQREFAAAVQGTSLNGAVAVNTPASGTTASYGHHERKIYRFIAAPDVDEDEDEEEYEAVSAGKHLEGTPCFSTLFYIPLPDYLHHNNKSSLAFCKQRAFLAVNDKHVIFQVFRI